MFESNPILTRATGRAIGGSITFDGIIHRTGLLLVATMAAFGLSWVGMGGGLGVDPQTVYGISTLGAVAGVILALYLAFTQSCNPYLISLYAITQGLILGVVSRLAEARFPGVAAEAATGTFAVFLLTLGAYRIRLIRYTPLVAKIIVIGLVATMALYLVSAISGFFGHPLAAVTGHSNLAIGISCVITFIAAISFVMDFARAEAAVEQGAPDEYAWQIAFGLIIGLVFLYIQILQLLTQLRSRD